MEPIGYGISYLLTDINIHSDTQAEPRKLSSLTLYIDLWQEGKPAPGKNPPVISPPVVIFRRIGVRAEIRTQNPVLSNTRLVKMVPLSYLRRHEGKYDLHAAVTFFEEVELVFQDDARVWLMTNTFSSPSIHLRPSSALASTLTPVSTTPAHIDFNTIVNGRQSYYRCGRPGHT
jgi:hypothetical protein